MPNIKHLAVMFVAVAVAVAIIARVPFLRQNVLAIA